MANLSVQLAPKNPRGLFLRSPVMTASGTFGYGLELADYLDLGRIGAIVCKGTTLEPREGNPLPRIIEIESGIINSIGLQNVGIEKVIKEIAPRWANLDVPVIVNISGSTFDEYATISRMLTGVKGIAALEINISCPNVERGGIEFGVEKAAAAEVTARVKSNTNLPIIVKLSPQVADIIEIASAVAQAGADALTLVNTIRGISIDVIGKKSILGNISGGISGRILKPIALNMVYRVAKEVNIPIIGCGGINNVEDALEFIMAGAKAVQIGTACLKNPQVLITISEGIERYLVQNGYQSVDDIIGIIHKAA